MPASVSAYAQLVRRGSCWLVRVTQPGRIVWRSYRVADVSPTEAVARAGGRAGVASVAWQLSLDFPDSTSVEPVSDDEWRNRRMASRSLSALAECISFRPPDMTCRTVDAGTPASLANPRAEMGYTDKKTSISVTIGDFM